MASEISLARSLTNQYLKAVRMDTTSNSADAAGDNSISDSFLTTSSGQFLVEAGGDGEETLGSAENEDEPRGSDEPLREQDRFLPIANVARIMKKSIPKSGKIAKDAKECVQECSTKGEKGVISTEEGGTIDLPDDTFAHALTNTILQPDQQQQNVIYTAAYPNQITPISFG
ncbi:hypothetical protein KUTeg_020752 [Tegillarca granosa]|uniref:Transcription factor CBF/NF-Y/archaeal histone domain-containing protein n=1 Tax=Tegillarca granosa TaxID=220873 RepID=A0ABQ9EE52_TEGGR|nr:hypothetical protein KUTeg_020752 [Tegillarca granosa]